MIGDNARKAIANSGNFKRAARLFVNTKIDRLQPGETPDVNPNIITTTGAYHLKYTNKSKYGIEEKLDHPYILKLDFPQMDWARFRNWPDFVKEAKENSILKFIKDYTNICEQTFLIAGQNPGMIVPITFDIIKFDTDVRAKYNWGKKERHLIYNPFDEKVIEEERNERV